LSAGTAGNTSGDEYRAILDAFGLLVKQRPALERHGLASREPDARDRRIKNLVLTPEGIAETTRQTPE
jgi:hypothetical protein